MDIDRWRARIDEIDEEIVRLLNERVRCALEIGQIKRRNRQEIYDPARERRFLERVISMSTGPLTEEAIRRLYACIMDESRRLERRQAEEDDAGKDGVAPPSKEPSKGRKSRRA